jgi:hypothetical protein
MGDNDVNTLPDHLIGKLFGAIASPVGTAELDVNVLAFRIAEGGADPARKPGPPPGAPCQLAGGCNTLGKHSTPQIAPSQEGVPALFGGVVPLDFINAFATNRTKANMNPPPAVPYITEAGT